MAINVAQGRNLVQSGENERWDVMQNDLIGVGLYTVPETARLTGVSSARIRRWLGGYHYRYRGEEKWSEPLWHSQLPEFDGVLSLGFRDLAEIRVVDSLIQARLSLRTVRTAMIRAREILHDERPFTTAKFRTDGISIFLEIAQQADDPVLLDLLKNQYGMRRVIEPSFKNLDYENDVAVRWWPMSHKHQVVIDPKRNFGAPIVDEGSVSTSVLAGAVVAEGSVKAVARYYNVNERAIRDAVLFEEKLAA